MAARIYKVSITQLSHCGWLEGRLALPPRPSVRQCRRPPSTADPGWAVGAPRSARASAFLSHLNIPPFFVENKRPPSSRPFSPFYTGAGMKLSSIQPPPHCGPENRKIPNESIFPPSPYKIQPLTPSATNPIRLTETHPPVTIRADHRRAAWPTKALLLCESC